MVEEVDRAEATRLALVPEDTPRNRLFLRYLKSAEGTLDRALKALARLQADRAKAEASGGEGATETMPEPVLPSEPNPTAPPVPDLMGDGCCADTPGGLPSPAGVEWREGSLTLGSEGEVVLPVAVGLAGSGPGR